MWNVRGSKRTWWRRLGSSGFSAVFRKSRGSCPDFVGRSWRVAWQSQWPVRSRPLGRKTRIPTNRAGVLLPDPRNQSRSRRFNRSQSRLLNRGRSLPRPLNRGRLRRSRRSRSHLRYRNRSRRILLSPQRRDRFRHNLSPASSRSFHRLRLRSENRRGLRSNHSNRTRRGTPHRLASQPSDRASPAAREPIPKSIRRGPLVVRRLATILQRSSRADRQSPADRRLKQPSPRVASVPRQRVSALILLQSQQAQVIPSKDSL